jgi:hypothetical protein
MTTRAEEMIERDGYLERARAEMRRAGLYDEDASYGAGAIAEGVIALLDTWHRQGHSGGSASLTLYVFNKLVEHKVLAPITNETGEWMNVSEYGGRGQPATWQNRRMPSVFSHDGGKTWYDVNERRSWWRKKLGLGWRGFHIHVSKDLLA